MLPLFCSWPNMAGRCRWTDRCKALRLTYWNADGVRGRTLKLEHFINQHHVNICHLSEAFLNTAQAFQLEIMSATVQTDYTHSHTNPQMKFC
jgi:hypothetical protein